MFRTATLVAFLASAVSASIIPSGDVAADSPLGLRLLNKATVVEDARHLDQERDVTFIANYSIRYVGCSSLTQVSPEGQNNDNGEGMLYTQHLVRFALCPTSSCSSSCSGGGEYVMSMEQFVDSYTEAKLTEQEYACETIRENCYCSDDSDDEACETACYTAAGMDVCIEYEGEEEFEIQRYLECQEMEGGNGNNNGNGNYNYQNYGNGEAYYGSYYIGPYCNPKDGKSIHLGIFYDQGCTAHADSSVYAAKNYGAELPFASKSIVSSGCMDCKQVEDDDGNNNNNNGYEAEYEVTEFCQENYEQAARCEEKMDITYPDTSGCNYINNVLPQLESVSRNLNGGSTGGAAKAFATIFAFTTALFAAYAYFLYRKIKRGSVDLSAE